MDLCLHNITHYCSENIALHNTIGLQYQKNKNRSGSNYYFSQFFYSILSEEKHKGNKGKFGWTSTVTASKRTRLTRVSEKPRPPRLTCTHTANAPSESWPVTALLLLIVWNFCALSKLIGCRAWIYNLSTWLDLCNRTWRNLSGFGLLFVEPKLGKFHCLQSSPSIAFYRWLTTSFLGNFFVGGSVTRAT